MPKKYFPNWPDANLTQSHGNKTIPIQPIFTGRKQPNLIQGNENDPRW